MTRHDLTQDRVMAALKGVSVPAQPQILLDIHTAQAMPSPDLDRIAYLVGRDVGLAGMVLKVVNSKAFGLSNKIVSVHQAVQLLGVESLVNIINGLSIKSQLDDNAAAGLRVFWSAATVVAMNCAYLAKAIGFQSPDVAYTLGLFHNCGVPLLMSSNQHYSVIIEESYETNSERITDIENQHLNTNHAVVGFFVAKSWNLPSEMCEVIAEHHSVNDIFNNVRYANYSSYKKTLLSILKMAEHSAKLHLVLGGQEEDWEWEAIEASLLTYVGLTQSQFKSLSTQLAESLEGAGITL